MPLCPICDAELEPDAVFELVWCWHCRISYGIDADGYLYEVEPGKQVADVTVDGRLL